MVFPAWSDAIGGKIHHVLRAFVITIFQTWFAIKVCACIANLIMISYIKATNQVIGMEEITNISVT